MFCVQNHNYLCKQASPGELNSAANELIASNTTHWQALEHENKHSTEHACQEKVKLLIMVPIRSQHHYNSYNKQVTLHTRRVWRNNYSPPPFSSATVNYTPNTARVSLGDHYKWSLAQQALGELNQASGDLESLTNLNEEMHLGQPSRSHPALPMAPQKWGSWDPIRSGTGEESNLWTLSDLSFLSSRESALDWHVLLSEEHRQYWIMPLGLSDVSRFQGWMQASLPFWRGHKHFGLCYQVCMQV